MEFKNICKKYENAERNSVTDFNLTIEEKEFIAFVGPSGCGKSTTLRMVAGFEEITSGDLYIDGKRVNDMAEVQKKVDWAIRILGLEEFRTRKPKTLSGGQRQRVALGRAIVKNQKLFLMDEPLSNLDAKLRVSMRNEISKLHRELGTTTIYVTHDQVEAMTMADRIVIMKDGVIQQAGAPMELYEHPVNKFVAGFIGSPQMNFYPVTIHGKELRFRDGSMILLPDEVTARLQGRNGELIMGIRGEDLKLDAESVKQYNDSIQRAVVENAEVMGNENNLYFTFGGSLTVARVSKYEVSRIGDKIAFVFLPGKMHFFDKDTENAIG